MRDYEGFADPASPKNALLVECGQHWEAASALIAIHSALRFLLVNGVVDADWASQGLAGLDLPEQRFVEVTGPVTITSEHFRFAETFNVLAVITKAGTVIAYHGHPPGTTPQDDSCPTSPPP